MTKPSIGQEVTAPPSGGPGAGAATIRVGCVSYLNTLPLIEGLRAPGGATGLEFIPAPPAELIGMLTGTGDAGESGGARVDAALVSLIDYQRSPVPLALIPAGVIGSPGETHTVRLFSRTPIGEITELCCDAESHTSVALARILLAEVHGAKPSVRTIRWDTSAARECRAVLLIGDKVASRAPARDDYPHQMDLGRAWREMTGLPFVYAAWMCRGEDAESAGIARLAALLDRTRRHNGTRLGWIASTHAPAHMWPVDEARRYLGQLLSFDADESARGAVDRFFDLAMAHGLIGERRPTRWLDRAAAMAR